MPQFPGQIQLTVVGKLRERHWRQAQADYLRRIRRYIDIRLVEVKDAVGRGLPPAQAMQREGEKLLQTAVSCPRQIALTPQGRQLTSPQLADFIQQQMEIYGRFAFFIGGPHGLSPDLIAACDIQLSLSRLTFPHELARVLFLEQLYRAYTILNHEKYHR